MLSGMREARVASVRTASSAWMLLASLSIGGSLSGCPRAHDDADGGPTLDAPARSDTPAATCAGPALACDGAAITRCVGDHYEPTGEICDELEGESCRGGFCVNACEAAAAAQSYVGCEYWPTVTPNFVDDPTRYRFAVVVANTGPVEARVRVERGAETVAEVTVPPEGVQEIILPWVEALLGAGASDATSNVLLADGAYRLVSTQPVSAYQFSPFEDRVGERPSYSNDASLLLPTSALGRDYRVVAHASHLLAQGIRETLDPANPSSYPGSPAFFTVVGTEDGTSVTVRAHGRTQPGPGTDTALVEGDERTYTLDRGDVLLVLSKLWFFDEAECVQPEGGGGGCSSRLTDLTGTEIESTAPVAVFGGHRCVDLPREWLFCDHLEEQMVPVSAWGVRAVGVSSHPIVPEETSIFRIVSASNGNHVEVSPASLGSFDLDDGDFVDLELAGGIEVRGTGRLQLVQYETSGQRTSIVFGSEPIATGDPSMALVVPVEQQRRDYVFLAPSTFEQSFVLVAAPMDAQPMLDGVVVPALTPIEGSGYGWVRVPLGAGAHRMIGASPFGITVQGVAPACSYMFPGGLDVETLLL